jgi:Transcriptional regulator, AbiEi antitoxin/Protein of unknown function (DUF559)
VANNSDHGAPRRSGVATLSQLRSAGTSAEQVRLLVKRGRLVTIRKGVYTSAERAAAGVTDRGRGEALRIAAVSAACDFLIAGSHSSAAVIHGLDLVGSQRAGAVTVTRSPRDRGSHSLRAGVSVHLAELPERHVILKDGIRLTSVARTVVDLARTVPFAEGVAVADSALRDKQATRGELETVLGRCARWPGIQRARRVIAFADPLAESVLESISRVAFHEHGLPPPELQVWVGGADEIAGRVDFLWRAHRTIAEADGAIKYTRPARALAQLNRDARLREAGFEVVHFTWAEITRVPAQVVAAIRAAFRQQSGTQRA